MKQVVLLFVMALSLSITATAVQAKTVNSASGVEVDASLVVASGPASGFDSTLGITFGAGKMLPNIDRNLQGRVELSYFSWSATSYGVDLTYTRVPIAVAARYYLPLRGNPGLKAYGQGGIELSFDTAEAAVPAPFPARTVTASESDVRLGIVPGFGISLALSPQLSLDTDMRLHLITDSYLTLQAGVAYHF